MKRLWIIAALLACSCRAQDAGVWWGALAADAVQEFTPLSISGCLVWLDASDISSVTLDSSVVAAWQNKASTNTAVQSVPERRPGYITGERNGHNVVRFDGLNDALGISGITLPTHFSLFVIQSSLASSYRFFMEHGENINSYPGFFFAGKNVAAWAVRREGYDVHAGPDELGLDYLGNGWKLAEFLYNGMGTVMTNGVFVTDATARGSALPDSDVTARLNIGCRAQASLFLAGDIAEILIFRGVVSTNDRQTVEAYLGTKWGITVSP